MHSRRRLGYLVPLVFLLGDGHQPFLQVIEDQTHIALILADCGGSLFHDPFQPDDIVEELPRDVAGRHGFQDDKGRVHEHDPPLRVIVEHAARQQRLPKPRKGTESPGSRCWNRSGRG